MDDEREIITIDQAIPLLDIKRHGGVHTFRQVGPLLLGVEIEATSLIDAMRQAPAIEVTGANAQSMNHGLAITDSRGLLFIATKPAEAATQ